MFRPKSGRIVALLLVVCLMMSQMTFTAAAASDKISNRSQGEVLVSAQSAILMDGHSHKVLFAKSATDPCLIASTTKIMTALVVLEQAEDLDATVTVTDHWASIEGSSMYLEVGDEVSIRGLLYGLILNSGNDAATALAETIGGDEATFVAMMNEYAERFGMKDTHFANPHGLDAPDHYSTAYDMALLMSEAMKNESFREICQTRTITIDGYELYFHNKLLNRYKYCVAGKTGYTIAAGRTLVTASERDGQLLIAVTLNAPDDWNDQIAMYEYGFNNYHETALCTGGKCFSAVPIQDSCAVVPVYYDNSLQWLIDADDTVQRIVYLPEHFNQYVSKGSIVGRVTFLVNGEQACSTFLIAGAYADFDSGEVSYEWRNDFRKSCLLAGLYPDAQPNGTYRMEGLLSTAFSHNWA